MPATTTSDTAHQPRTGADADVLIVGAGPAGLALACALHDAGLAVQVLEQQPRSSLAEPAEDGRDIALTHRGRAIMQELGLWAQLPPGEIAPLREAQVTDGGRPQALHFGNAGQGDPLGWLVPNHHIRAAAWQAVLARPAIQVHTEARVTALDLSAPARAALQLASGQTLGAPMVVAADSRFSAIRRMAGIGAAMRDFGRSVVVGRVAHADDHQGIARECFRYGNTLALLPMTGRQCSAVVTVAGHQAAEWLALSDHDFAGRVHAQSGGLLGPLRAVGPRHHYPLVGVLSQRFVAPRFALVGDAAVGMHPVTAHGYNFGLYGVQVLARQLQAARQARQDIGGLAVLQPYEAEHRRTTLPVYLGTNAVVSLFTDERPAARLARRAVLAVAEHAPALSGLLKSAITRQLTGVPGTPAGLRAAAPASAATR